MGFLLLVHLCGSNSALFTVHSCQHMCRHTHAVATVVLRLQCTPADICANIRTNTCMLICYLQNRHCPESFVYFMSAGCNMHAPAGHEHFAAPVHSDVASRSCPDCLQLCRPVSRDSAVFAKHTSASSWPSWGTHPWLFEAVCCAAPK